MKKDIDIVDALLDALNVHQEIPPSVRLIMNEAACTIINLRQAQFYDQCRLSALEDLGCFAIDKQDGEDPEVTVQVWPGQYFAAKAATVREAVDLALEERGRWRRITA